LLQVKVGDRCLDGVAAGVAPGDRPLQQLTAFDELGVVPEVTVLVVEQHDVAVRVPRITTNIGEAPSAMRCSVRFRSASSNADAPSAVLTTRVKPLATLAGICAIAPPQHPAAPLRAGLPQ